MPKSILNVSISKNVYVFISNLTDWPGWNFQMKNTLRILKIFPLSEYWPGLPVEVFRFSLLISGVSDFQREVHYWGSFSPNVPNIGQYFSTWRITSFMLKNFVFFFPPSFLLFVVVVDFFVCVCLFWFWFGFGFFWSLLFVLFLKHVYGFIHSTQLIICIPFNSTGHPEEAPSSWLQSGSALAILAFWEVSHQIEGSLSLRLSLSLSVCVCLLSL